MALTDKNIVITPNIGSSADPKIVFSGANASTGAQTITLNVYPTNNGTISFEGSSGQLFSIANSLTGTIYAVSDISGVPSLEILDSGLIKLAQYNGSVVVGGSTTDGTAKLQVLGGPGRFGNVYVGYGTYKNSIRPVDDNNLNFDTPSGYAGSNTSLRAPIFYDSDNTSYYIDPAGASLSASLNGPIVMASTDWTGEVPGKIQYHSNNWYFQYSSYFHFRNASGSNTFYGDSSGNTWSGGSSRAPIFYDSADTNFYIDANTTSNIYALNLTGATNNYLHINPGNGYEAMVRYIGGSGSSWYVGKRITSSLVGTESFHFYSEAAGVTVGGVDTSGNMFASSSHRAPIFYDSNDTGYYINPNGGSRFSETYVDNSYTYGWFRNYGNQGLYNQDHGNHWYATGNDYWNLAGNNTSNVGIILRTGGHQGTVRGYVYADSNNNIGFLNSGGAWRLRVVGDDYSLADGSSMRAQLYYDSNDTGYYVDPNSTSRLNLINSNGIAITGSSSDRDVVRVIPKNAAASYNGTVTGAFKIRLPIRANDTMWQMTVKIYNYSNNNISEYKVASYSYSTGAYNTAASFNGSVNSSPQTVRIGNDGSYDCVWIGETDTSWSHPVVAVTEFVGGYSNASAANWDDNWEVSLVTSFGTVGSAISPDNKVYALTAASSMYSPIFYDSNNTAYFTDPASRSRQASIDFGDGGYYIHAGDWGMRNSTPYGWIQFGPANSGHAHIYTDRSNFYFNAQLIVNGGSNINTSDIRANIFYDNESTGYYVDPNATSNLAGLTVANTISGNISGNAATATRTSSVSGYAHAGTGMYAFYNWGGTNGGTSAPSDSSYTIGISVGSPPSDQAYGFQIARNMWNTGLWTRGYDSSFGSWVRLLDSSNYSDYAVKINDWHGNLYHHTDGRIYSTIYYDANDSGYYVDPNSTSRFSYIRPNRISVVGSQDNGEPRWDFKAYVVESQHHYAQNSTQTMYLGESNPVIVGGDIRSPVFYDSNDTSYYVNPNGTSNLAGGTIAGNGYIDFGPNSAWSATLRIGGNGHGGGDRASVVTTSGNLHLDAKSGSGIYLGYYTGGPIYATSLLYPVLHAGNYTSYALSLSGGTVEGVAYFQTNSGGLSGNTTSARLQAYSTGNNSAFMSFHKSGNYAINMGLDDDNVFRIGGWSASANRFQMDMSGNLTMAGNVTAYSDEGLKKDWAPVATDFVARLAGIKSGTYTRIDSGERQAGASAQDWQKLLPEVVNAGADGILSLAYGNAAMVSAVELAKRVVEQDLRIAKLEALVERLLAK